MGQPRALLKLDCFELITRLLYNCSIFFISACLRIYT